MNALSSRPARVAAAVVVQLALVAVAVSGQLSARLTGDEYSFRVEPVDPIDPFRGAYVALDYPDLVPNDQNLPGDRGDVFLPLTEDGEVWAAGTPARTRPDDGPYLACTDRNYEIRCGIDGSSRARSGTATSWPGSGSTAAGTRPWWPSTCAELSGALGEPGREGSLRRSLSRPRRRG